jgi:hypothetical protein
MHFGYKGSTENRILTNTFLTKLNALKENRNIIYFISTNHMNEADIAIKRYSFKNELKRFIFDTYSRFFGKDQADSESKKLMAGVDIILERPNFHPSYEEWKYFLKASARNGKRINHYQ